MQRTLAIDNCNFGLSLGAHAPRLKRQRDQQMAVGRISRDTLQLLYDTWLLLDWISRPIGVETYAQLCELQCPRMPLAVIALGSNLPGEQGSPAQMLDFAIGNLQLAGVIIVKVSPYFKSTSVSDQRAPDYVNAVLIAQTAHSPAALLRTLKRLERVAGRRTSHRWGPRPLDLDIISLGTSHYNWPARRAGCLTLPHPECHWRGFVLRPLASIHPHWYHPGQRLTARQLLARLPPQALLGLQPLPTSV